MHAGPVSIICQVFKEEGTPIDYRSQPLSPARTLLLPSQSCGAHSQAKGDHYADYHTSLLQHAISKLSRMLCAYFLGQHLISPCCVSHLPKAFTLTMVPRTSPHTVVSQQVISQFPAGNLRPRCFHTLPHTSRVPSNVDVEIDLAWPPTTYYCIVLTSHP